MRYWPWAGCWKQWPDSLRLAVEQVTSAGAGYPPFATSSYWPPASVQGRASKQSFDAWAWPTNVSCLARLRTGGPGQNRSYRQQKDRIATVRFTRYSGHRPSTACGVEISKAAARSLSMPKTRRPSAAHDVELALPTHRRRWAARNAGGKADIGVHSLTRPGCWFAVRLYSGWWHRPPAAFWKLSWKFPMSIHPSS